MSNPTPLSALRNLLIAQGLDGMIVPRADAHQSEDCTPHDNKLAWLTGFSGSAGLALVLRDRALLFVDGRYQVQARTEVDRNDFEIHHLHNEPLAEYLQEQVASGARIAFEPLLMVNSQFETLSHPLRTGGVRRRSVRRCMAKPPRRPLRHHPGNAR